MKKSISLLHDIGSHPLTALVGTLVGILSFGWFFYDKIVALKTGIASSTAFIIFFSIFLGIGFYSFRVRQRERALCDGFKRIHKINHDYRDALYRMFQAEQPVTDKQHLIQAEEHTLRAVCQQIKEIYEGLIGKPCMVTIKLITKESNNSRFCSTYVRSEENCERDRFRTQKYVIGKWVNTAFDKALIPDEKSGCAHFFSPDLTKENNYNNERQHWEIYYRSAIVVPIRAVKQGDRGNPDDYDNVDVGFLCLDTMSQNRLNGTYHVQLMAAFADQMYNFISLMRGKYVVNVQ